MLFESVPIGFFQLYQNTDENRIMTQSKSASVKGYRIRIQNLNMGFLITTKFRPTVLRL